MENAMTTRIQRRIAAARRRRFWRTCNNAFLAIHLSALLMVGFIFGDGWLFRAVLATIVFLPVLSYLENHPGAEKPTAQQINKETNHA
jgi:hypothetical protein